MLVVYVWMVNRRYPGGWTTALLIVLVAWLVTLIVRCRSRDPRVDRDDPTVDVLQGPLRTASTNSDPERPVSLLGSTRGHLETGGVAATDVLDPVLESCLTHRLLDLLE